MALYQLNNYVHISKGKSVPLQAWSGPEGSRKLSVSDFMTTAQDGGKVVSLTQKSVPVIFEPPCTLIRMALIHCGYKNMFELLISNFRRVLNVVCFLLGDSPASEFYMPTFRNTVPSS